MKCKIKHPAPPEQGRMFTAEETVPEYAEYRRLRAANPRLNKTNDEGTNDE